MAAVGHGPATRGAWGAWWEAARPRTLPLAAAPVLLGTALAAADGGAHAGYAALALATALCLQVGANLANDVFDFERGADGADRVGPPRASQQGWLAPRALRRAAFGALGAAALVGLPLALRGGWPLALAGALAIAAALAYTGGPAPYGYRGLGDAMVLLFFGVVAVCGSYYVQALALPGAVVVASLALGALATAVLAVNNLRDLESDRRAGKRTLAVLLGRRGALLELSALLLLPFAALPVLAGAYGAGVWLALAALPAALSGLRALWREPAGPGLNAALVRTVRLALAFALLLSLGVAAGGAA